MPFGYVLQFNALLLLFLAILSPVAIACFTPNSVILSAFLRLALALITQPSPSPQPQPQP